MIVVDTQLPAAAPPPEVSKLQLSEGQQQALEMTGRFLGQEEHHVGIITGYAGTGKTTMIRVIAEVHGCPEILTPTGKAALRVGEATGLGARTIHRFLYKPETDPKTGAPIFILKDIWEYSSMEGRLVLIDEASMVDKKVWIDLNAVAKKIGFKIILMGDLFQLPPVTKGKEDADFSSLNTVTPFSVNLTEVHRQALGSPIIRASMILRSNKPDFLAMQLLTAIGEDEAIATILDQRERGGMAICHTNSRRHWLNNRVRQAMGYQPGTLNDGEPLLVTQNNYDLDRYNGEVIDFKGWKNPPTIEQIVSDRYTASSLEMKYGVGQLEGGFGGPNILTTAMLSPDEVCGRTQGSNVGNWAIRKYSKIAYEKVGFREDAPPHLHAAYGYNLTAHKAQGSEWPEVLVILENSLGMLRGIEKKRWVYTSITRARDVCRYVYLSEDC